MDNLKVDFFLMTHARYFQGQHINYVRERLLKLEESKWPLIYTLDFKDPSTIQIVSLMAGGFGIDRFMIGDTGLGVAKLLTCGGFGIWTIVDWFGIMDMTRQKNMELLQQVLA